MATTIRVATGRVALVEASATVAKTVTPIMANAIATLLATTKSPDTMTTMEMRVKIVSRRRSRPMVLANHISSQSTTRAKRTTTEATTTITIITTLSSSTSSRISTREADLRMPSQINLRIQMATRVLLKISTISHSRNPLVNRIKLLQICH